MDRLTSSPLPASVCSNCGAYMLPPRCVCGWTDPDAVMPTRVVIDDSDDSEPDEPTWPLEADPPKDGTE